MNLNTILKATIAFSLFGLVMTHQALAGDCAHHLNPVFPKEEPVVLMASSSKWLSLGSMGFLSVALISLKRREEEYEVFQKDVGAPDINKEAPDAKNVPQWGTWL